jgi:hypothetical protein
VTGPAAHKLAAAKKPCLAKILRKNRMMELSSLVEVRDPNGS